MTRADVKDLVATLQRLEALPGFAALSAQVRQAVMIAVAVELLASSSRTDAEGLL